MKRVIPITSIRLSNSTMDLVNTCERKFQIEKLLHNDYAREHTPDTVFGTAYGIGVASYFIHKDEEKALYDLWMAYNPHLESEKKTLVKCVNLLMCSFAVIDNLLEEYEVVYFNGKPASELSFCIHTDSDYYFVGYMDIVLRGIYTGKYIVVDAKSTGLELENLDPVYKNSAQLIGYSIVLDAVVGEEVAEYDVMYFVGQTGRGFTPTIRPLVYTKTVLDRLQWFMSLGLDIERLERMRQLNFYPRRGTACLKYNRPCYHFGTCDLTSLDFPKENVEDTNEYDFHYNMQDLIDDHVRRVSNG